MKHATPTETIEIVKLRRELAEMTGELAKLKRERQDVRYERDGARADVHRFLAERDDLRGQLYRTREDLQARGRELDEARTELAEVRTARDEALEKIDILDEHRRADSQLIDRLTAERDEARDHCRSAAQILNEAIGAPGPESVEETARRAVATLEAWRYKAETTSEEAAKLRRDLGDVLALRDEALTRCHTVARTLTDAIGASGPENVEETACRAVVKTDEARTELEKVLAERDDALVKLECLDDHRRADSDLIDRLEYALRALIDSISATICCDKAVLRDLEAARALLGEGRS